MKPTDAYFKKGFKIQAYQMTRNDFKGISVNYPDKRKYIAKDETIHISMYLLTCWPKWLVTGVEDGFVYVKNENLFVNHRLGNVGDESYLTTPTYTYKEINIDDFVTFYVDPLDQKIFDVVSERDFLNDYEHISDLK